MNRIAYRDVEQLLRFAETNGSTSIKLESDAKAWQYLQRLNRFRKADRKDHGGSSIWDNWVFKRPVAGRIVIELRERFEPGNFEIFDAAGNSVAAAYERFYEKPDPLGNLPSDKEWKHGIIDPSMVDLERQVREMGFDPTAGLKKEETDFNPARPGKPLDLDE